MADERLEQGDLGSHPPDPKLEAGDLSALRGRLRLVPRVLRHYGWWKARLDPAYPFILSQIRDCREVLDLGAGMGLMEVLFAGRFPGARIRGAGVHVPMVEEIVSLLRDHRFRVEVRPSGRGVFSGNVMIVARKPRR